MARWRWRWVQSSCTMPNNTIHKAPHTLSALCGSLQNEVKCSHTSKQLLLCKRKSNAQSLKTSVEVGELEFKISYKIVIWIATYDSTNNFDWMSINWNGRCCTFEIFWRSICRSRVGASVASDEVQRNAIYRCAKCELEFLNAVAAKKAYICGKKRCRFTLLALYSKTMSFIRFRHCWVQVVQRSRWQCRKKWMFKHQELSNTNTRESFCLTLRCS